MAPSPATCTSIKPIRDQMRQFVSFVGTSAQCQRGKDDKSSIVVARLSRILGEKCRRREL
jgi:hypothetical protein